MTVAKVEGGCDYEPAEQGTGCFESPGVRLVSMTD